MKWVLKNRWNRYTLWCMMKEPIQNTEKSEGFLGINKVFDFEAVPTTLRKESIPV